MEDEESKDTRRIRESKLAHGPAQSLIWGRQNDCGTRPNSMITIYRIQRTRASAGGDIGNHTRGPLRTGSCSRNDKQHLLLCGATPRHPFRHQYPLRPISIKIGLRLSPLATLHWRPAISLPPLGSSRARPSRWIFRRGHRPSSQQAPRMRTSRWILMMAAWRRNRHYRAVPEVEIFRWHWLKLL